MTATTDTIAAVATPPGRGGVGIVRVSGPGTVALARSILGRLPSPREAIYSAFHDPDGMVLDRGIALYFPGPHSFTGEDVLELHGHGGPVVMDRLLCCTAALGARLARPGEFSERAFLNDKIDLAQAEAIADLIDSASEQAARAALRSLDGEFSARVHALTDAVTRLRTYVEAAIDFPEEEIDFLADDAVLEQLDDCIARLDGLRADARQGCLLQEGMNVVIAGRPNVGKSSLLNRLSGRDAAIVTDIPGTTRDLLHEQIHIDGMPLHVIDTAGLRDSDDTVEREGIQRAHEAIGRADRMLLVMDDAEDPPWDGLLPRTDPGPAGTQPPVTVVRNKIDRSGHAPELVEGERGIQIYLSALSGAGMDLLHRHLKECMGYSAGSEGGFMARRRHLDALERVRKCLDRGRGQLLQHHAGEMLAEDLRQAQHALGEITGEFTTEDLLDRIFAGFCIGK